MNSPNQYPSANERNNSKPKVYKLLKKKNTLINDSNNNQNKEVSKNNESLNIKRALNTTTYGVYKQNQLDLRDRILNKLNVKKANLKNEYEEHNNQYIMNNTSKNYSPPLNAVNYDNLFIPLSVQKETIFKNSHFPNHLRNKSNNFETTHLPTINDNFKKFNLKNLKEKQIRYNEYVSVNKKFEPTRFNYSTSKNEKSFISQHVNNRDNSFNKNVENKYNYNNNKRGYSLVNKSNHQTYNNGVNKKIGINMNIADDNSNFLKENNSFNHSYIRPNDPFKRTLSSDPDIILNNQNNLNSKIHNISNVSNLNEKITDKSNVKIPIDTRKFSILDIANHSNLVALQLQQNLNLSKSIDVHSSGSINENEIHNPFMTNNPTTNMIDDIYNLNQFKMEHENFEKLNSLSQYQTNLLIQLKNSGLNIDLSSISKSQPEFKNFNSSQSNKLADNTKLDSNSFNLNKKKIDFSNQSNISNNASKIISKQGKTEDLKRDDESIFCKTLLTEMISRKAIKIKNNINCLKDSKLKAIYIAIESNMIGLSKKIKLIISIPSIYNILKDYLLKNTISSIQFYIKQIDEKIGNKESIRDELANWIYKPTTSTIISYSLINKDFEIDLIKYISLSKEVELLFKIILIVFSVDEQICNENTMIKIYAKYKTDSFSKLF